MAGWPHLSPTQNRILTYALCAETARSTEIGGALGYTPTYVRQVFVTLRAAFGVHENATLLLRAFRTRTYNRE